MPVERDPPHMIEDLFFSGPRPVLGPMVVVCPEVAIEAPMDRVALQATAFCDWSGPLFFLGGDFDGGDLERPWQTDYLHAIDAMLDAGATRYICGATPTDLASGTRMMLRGRAFRKACDLAGGRVMVTGAKRESQIAAVSAVLRSGGLTPIGSCTAIGAAEIDRFPLSRMRA